MVVLSVAAVGLGALPLMRCLIPKKLRESPVLDWDRNDANGTGVTPNDFDSFIFLWCSL